MAAGFTPVGFRLRSDWLGVTVRGVQEALTQGQETPLQADLEGRLESYADAFIENAASLEHLWEKLQEQLRFTGMPAAYVRETVVSAKAMDEAARPALDELEKHLPTRRTDLTGVRQTLDRIRCGVAVLEPVLDPPEIDLVAIRTGLEEMARGQGIDSGELLEQYLRTGEL